MAFGQFFNNFGRRLSDTWHKVKSTVSGAATGSWNVLRTKVWPTIQHSAEGVGHELKSVVTTVHQDARDLTSGVGNLWRHEFDGIKGSIDHTVDAGTGAVKSVGQSLSMPLSIGLGAAALLGAVVLMKK